MLFKQPSSRAPHDEDDNAPIWSPVIKQAIEDWYTAKHDHDEDGQKNAARDMINATAAYHKAGGVPLFAHLPLPPQFVSAELGKVQHLPPEQSARVIDTFIGKFDDSAKPIVAHQVAAAMRSPSTEADSDARSRDAASVAPPPLVLKPPDAEVANSTFLRPPQAAGVTFSSAPKNAGAGATRRTPEQIADDLDRTDPLARAAHPVAYGTDEFLNDWFGEHGALGDWGKRPVVPKPKGELNGAVAEATRNILEVGTTIYGGAAVSKVALRSKFANLSKEAIISGVLSLAAEWMTHRDAPPGEGASTSDYIIAFLSGAASPIAAAHVGKYKYVSDVALAMGASIMGDYFGGKEISVTRALGAGLAAVLVSHYGVEDEVQGAARIGRKFAEKIAKDVLKELFGDVQFSGKEWSEIWQGFGDFQQRQRKDTKPVIPGDRPSRS